MDFVNKIFRGDRVVWMIFMFLCLISIVEVYSASSTLTYRANYWEPIGRHTMFLLVGTAVVLIAHSVKPKYFSILAVMVPIAWGLLIVTKVMGNSVNGADRWLSIGGITFQPSELAKLSLIVFTAFVLSKHKEKDPKDKCFFWIMGFSIPTCTIILLDNFSTAALLFVTIYIMMFIGQISGKRILQLTGLMFIVLSLFVSCLIFVPSDTINKIFPRGVTWKERIKDFNHDKKDITDSTIAFSDDNYQVSHSKIAITRGGVFGKMPGNSLERDFLPQAYSDFIFAIIIEEMGFLGGIFVLLLYVILFIRAGIIANRCERIFPKYLVIGSALIIVSQALANMAVAVNLIPVTGQPLPLISRGGTSTLITCVYVGIILSVSRFENPKGIQREVAIALESEEEKREANEIAFEEENINAGEY
ncbi:MAG: FtsW/RodA/SpoVE family cell cycle protein [Dysgonamonadaceae bacterium]|jgi:cell division protein FtsW|nr:FtsW/RodA/SpoVE family cell cycle protein [Dysgonamonadaceae bacterium]